MSNASSTSPSAANVVVGEAADDSEIFTLQVKGRRNYDILRQVRDAFEAYSAIEKLRKIVSVSSGKGSEATKRKSSKNDGQRQASISPITLEE